MGRIEGKTAVITGAGNGIGRACMKLFSQEGARVFGISKTEANLRATLDDVRAGGGTGGYAVADLSDAAAAERAVNAALEELGRIDILINAAGVGYNTKESSPGSMADVANTPIDKWREVMAINLDSVFYMVRLVVPKMQSQGGGTIVNVASIYGMKGVADAHTYTATKGAIINLTRSLCVAYAKDNIRANAVAPGFVDTQMVASVMPYFNDPATAEMLSPMKRAARPEEIAYACLFLAGDESTYCNGSILVADGGSTAR